MILGPCHAPSIRWKTSLLSVIILNNFACYPDSKCSCLFAFSCRFTYLCFNLNKCALLILVQAGCCLFSVLKYPCSTMLTLILSHSNCFIANRMFSLNFCRKAHPRVILYQSLACFNVRKLPACMSHWTRLDTPTLLPFKGHLTWLMLLTFWCQLAQDKFGGGVPPGSLLPLSACTDCLPLAFLARLAAQPA